VGSGVNGSKGQGSSGLPHSNTWASEAWGWGGTNLTPIDSASVNNAGNCNTTSSDSAGDVEAGASGETARLRSELQHMQQALHDTQAALIGQYRGRGNKFVGGAQFRTEARRPMTEGGNAARGKPSGTNVPTVLPPAHKCPECAAMRALMKTKQTEGDFARTAEAGLRARLSEAEATVSSLKHQLKEARAASERAVAAESSALETAASQASAIDGKEAELKAVRVQLQQALMRADAATQQQGARASAAAAAAALHERIRTLSVEMERSAAVAAAAEARMQAERTTAAGRDACASAEIQRLNGVVAEVQAACDRANESASAAAEEARLVASQSEREVMAAAARVREVLVEADARVRDADARAVDQAQGAIFELCLGLFS
jgi:hypothetical protein